MEVGVGLLLNCVGVWVGLSVCGLLCYVLVVAVRGAREREGDDGELGGKLDGQECGNCSSRIAWACDGSRSLNRYHLAFTCRYRCENARGSSLYHQHSQ
jgi:hypothetical protein